MICPLICSDSGRNPGDFRADPPQRRLVRQGGKARVLRESPKKQAFGADRHKKIKKDEKGACDSLGLTVNTPSPAAQTARHGTPDGTTERRSRGTDGNNIGAS